MSINMLLASFIMSLFSADPSEFSASPSDLEIVNTKVALENALRIRRFHLSNNPVLLIRPFLIEEKELVEIKSYNDNRFPPLCFDYSGELANCFGQWSSHKMSIMIEQRPQESYRIVYGTQPREGILEEVEIRIKFLRQTGNLT